jgi:hypothetical protein
MGIIFNFHIQSTDLSLRGTAANCLRQLITFVAHPPPVAQRRLDANRLLHSHLIPLVLRGLHCQGGGEKKDADEVRNSKAIGEWAHLSSSREKNFEE